MERGSREGWWSGRVTIRRRYTDGDSDRRNGRRPWPRVHDWLNDVGWLLLLTLLAVPGEVAAQDRLGIHRVSDACVGPPSLDLSAVDLAIAAPPIPPPRQQSGRPDSLSNGIIIGAVVGGVALGTFAGVLCKAMQEPGNPSCIRDALRIGAVGAAIGVAAGIAIDAALTRNGGLRVSVGLRF